MKRHAMLLAALALMGAQSTWAAVICEPGPDGRMIAVSPWGDAPPTPAQRQRCEAGNPPSKPPAAQTGGTDQSVALTQAAVALEKAAQALAQRSDATHPAAASVPTKPAEPVWTLNKGESIDQGLQRWAKQASWTVIWDVPKDWVVPNGVQFRGAFADAAANVVRSLNSNGAAVRADVYQGNRTIVVRPYSSTGEQP